MNRIVKNILLAGLGTFAYGLVLGWWRSPLMALYVGIKLPVVFFGTTVLVSVFSWTTAQLAG